MKRHLLGHEAFAGEVLTATYDFPYLAHAPMEPLNCTARVDGNKVKLAFGSQIPTLDQLNAALVVKTLPGAVETSDETRLGFEAARHRPRDFSDGVWVTELAPLYR